MTIVVLLGRDNKYLGYHKFSSYEKVEAFVESIEDLMLANIERKLTLRERLDLHCPKYFPLAGAVQDCEIISEEEN